MRGKVFHNAMVYQGVNVFQRLGWRTYVEYPYRCGNITTYFDIFAIKNDIQLACEVETSTRHALDNAIKAKAVCVELWVILPSRKLLKQVEQKLSSNGYPTKVLLPESLEAELSRKEVQP